MQAGKVPWWLGSTLQAFIFEAIFLSNMDTHSSFGVPMPFSYMLQRLHVLYTGLVLSVRTALEMAPLRLPVALSYAGLYLAAAVLLHFFPLVEMLPLSTFPMMHANFEVGSDLAAALAKISKLDS